VSEPAWKAANRAHWDELVAVHLSPRGYDLTSLRERRRRLNAIEEAELWPVDGQYILHLQCHFGADTLTLAQRGATVVGLDFLPPAVMHGCSLSVGHFRACRANLTRGSALDINVPRPGGNFLRLSEDPASISFPYRNFIGRCCRLPAALAPGSAKSAVSASNVGRDGAVSRGRRCGNLCAIQAGP
jgi:hypothetical protein